MIINYNKIIHLQGKNISYIMTISENGDLLHYYFGKKLADREYTTEMVWDDWCPFTPEGYTLNNIQQEYPSYGYADLRESAFDADKISQLKFKNIEISNDVPSINGMPHLLKKKASAQTAYITLEDTEAGIEVVLIYTVFDEYDIIARSAIFKNVGKDSIKLSSIYSSCLEMPNGKYDVMYLPGGWARERQLERTEVKPGEKINIANATGGSGHNMNPFVMIADKNADEKNGEVFSFSLVYSGNHSTMIDSNVNGGIRVLQGINPRGFEWELKSDESFETPQSIMCCSENGFGGISRELSKLYKNNLCRSEWTKKPRPVLINNWEATYFDFTEEKLLAIAEKAKSVGVELFVLDDGWFGKRNEDNCSLGDWVVNTEKLPLGIGGLAEKINKIGMKFGLWFEPEMVNPDSELYRSHPDWVIHTDYHLPAKSRNQLILDLSRKEVCDYIIESVSKVLLSGNVEYIKWDMNRPMTDMPCLGYNHKYILGFYYIMDKITASFPKILFEGCAGGGGRFDAGVLYYMPQIWTSDNSDAIARLKIQYGTSMAYPISAISAHVTASPNHQNGRVTKLKTRADIAYAGAFGYELDITAMSEDEIEEVKEQIKIVKTVRELNINGDFYRLQNPFESNYCAWQLTDGKTVFVMMSKILSERNNNDYPVKLEALEADAEYKDIITNETYGGDELMYRGITPHYDMSDFSTCIYIFKKLD